MPIHDMGRLQATLGGDNLAWIVERLRQRVERGDALLGAITLRDPSPSQRAAVDRLLGRRPSSGAMLSVDLMHLAGILRHAELCDELVEAVEALAGPLINLRSAQAEIEAHWQRLFTEMGLRCAGRPDLILWLEELRASGLLRRLTNHDVRAAECLLDQALELASRLPVAGIPLAELAADVAGDSHALDIGRPLGTIALRAAAVLGGIERGGVQANGDAESWRDAWAAVGVLCDELSAPVLVLNLRGDADSLTGRALRLHSEAGEPYRLSIRQLLRHPPELTRATAGPAVYICENPNVVAAAANRLGACSAPLVCLDGQPKTAARLLLSRLAASGVHLAYHGDFDWPGLRIANLVLRRHGAVPWRMSASDFARAAGGRALEGTPVDAIWDQELRPAMQAAGRAVHEEQVLGELLADLAGA